MKPTVTPRELLADHAHCAEPTVRPGPLLADNHPPKHPLRRTLTEVLDFFVAVFYYTGLILLAFAITAAGCGMIAYAISVAWNAGK